MKKIFMIVLLLSLLGAGCQAQTNRPGSKNGLMVLASESYLADIAQNVAGERLTIEALIPLGVDPHAFEPTPQDVVRIAQSQVLIVNGAGFEEWLQEVLQNAGGERVMVEASAGLASRQPQEGEPAGEQESEDGDDRGDPHFWLDPNQVIHYVENIRDGLSQADPAGKEVYAQNAQQYIGQLRELDRWIQQQVEQIPAENRLLVTNHESFGYFADRYGFRIVGAVIPSLSSSAAPSAQQMAALIESIRESGAPAIFLETGANPQLAEQIAQETDSQVVTDLSTHSLSEAGGLAPTYIDMMRYNVEKIVAALK